MNEEIKLEGIFDKIENAITYYLMEKKVNKCELWKYDINVFELSLFIEEHLKNNQMVTLEQLNEILKQEKEEKQNGIKIYRKEKGVNYNE